MGATARLARRVRLGWLVAVLAAGVAAALIMGSTALGDAPGPTLTVDQSFNSGQPVAPSFAADGSGASPGGVLFASAIQPDGKVIVVGQNSNGTVADFDIARYNADGTLDTSFGAGGYVQVAPTANKLNFADAVALDPGNGDIVIAGGNISGPDVPELVRLTPSGALDTGFGSGGVMVDSADAGSFLVGAVVDSSHRIVTIGSDGVVRRYAADGSVDSTFGSGGHTSALVSGPAVGSNVLALQPADGKILVAGSSSSAGTVVRLNPDGTLDSTFGTGGTATLAAGTAIRQMTLEGTSIVVGGSDASGNGMLARLTAAGALDASFGTAAGYDTFAAPSGYSEHVDALFYDPGSPPGLIFCLYQTKTGSQTGGCSTLGVDGQTAGTPIPIQGTPKDGGYGFIPNSEMAMVSYAGVALASTGGGGACPAIALTDSGIAQNPGTVGNAYGASFIASGGAPPYTFALAAGSSLPEGVSLGSDGSLVGVPKTDGNYTVTVTVTDSHGCRAIRTVTLKIGCPPVVVAHSTVHEGVVGQYYSLAFEASGGTPPYTFTESAMPPGLTLDGTSSSPDGFVYGKPTTPGTYQMTVTAKDSTTPIACTGTDTVTVVVIPPPPPPSSSTTPPAVTKTQKDKDELMKLDNKFEAVGAVSGGWGTVVMGFGAILISGGQGAAALGAGETATVAGAPVGVPTLVAGGACVLLGTGLFVLGKHFANASIDPPDRNFNALARLGRPMLQRLSVPKGASRAARRDIAAINAELANGAELNAVIDAMITSNNRATGARAAHNRKAEVRQLRAVAKYALLAAKLTLRDIALRTAILNAFRATRFNVTASAHALLAFAHSVALNGLPAQATAALKAFGLTAAQIQDVTARLAQPPAVGGSLDTALGDPSTDVAERSAAAALRSFASRARAALR